MPIASVNYMLVRVHVLHEVGVAQSLEPTGWPSPHYLANVAWATTATLSNASTRTVETATLLGAPPFPQLQAADYAVAKSKAVLEELTNKLEGNSNESSTDFL